MTIFVPEIFKWVHLFAEGQVTGYKLHLLGSLTEFYKLPCELTVAQRCFSYIETGYTEQDFLVYQRTSYYLFTIQ